MKIETYKQIRKKLSRISGTLLKIYKKEGITRNQLKQRQSNIDGMENRLIEVPQNVEAEFNSLYVRNPDEVEGKLGITTEEYEQYDGIVDLSLLVLVSNRAKNYFSSMLNNENLDQEEKNNYREAKNNALLYKDNATSELIAALFVLENTGEEFKDFFSYGNRKDEEGKNSFVIDIPCIGQMCVHYGHEIKRNEILKNAEEQAISILEEKKQLGQITEEKLQELKEKIQTQGILPEYNSKLYEYDASLPLEYEGSRIKRVKEILGISGKLPEHISDADIQKIATTGLNPREAHYLGVKLQFPKSLLLKIDEEFAKTEKKPNLEGIRKLYTEQLSSDDLKNVSSKMRAILAQFERC